MNKLTIIGNLTREPEGRSTKDGIKVCSFSVAVNRRQGEKQVVDYFRVTAWRGLAEICTKYLDKWKKVAVTGPVSLNQYTGQDGKTHASMEVTAEDVEFLTPRGENGEPAGKPASGPEGAAGFVEVDDADLPF